MDAPPTPPPEPDATNAPEAQPPAVTVKGQPVRLAAPASLTMAFEVRDALLVSHQRAYAAALGLCWPKLARKVPYRFDVLPYGGRVLDYLLDQGVPYHEVMQAGLAAYRLITRDLLSLAEVKEAQDFSEAPPDEDSA